MKIRNAVIVYTNPTTAEYRLTLDHVKKVLSSRRLHYSLADRDRLEERQFSGKDIVIAVGGDGTFLRAAQFVKTKLIFGVNADPQNKEGFFMKSSRNDFAAKLKRILDSNFSIKKLPRLEAFIDGKKISSLATNEFYIGPKKGYHASKYLLKIGKKSERQKSSGVLVTTAAGSFAWAKSLGCSPMQMGSRKFQYVVREPYELKVFSKYALKHGTLGENEKVEIRSEMLDGVIVADSVGKEHAFCNGSKSTIKMSKNPVSAAWF